MNAAFFNNGPFIVSKATFPKAVNLCVLTPNITENNKEGITISCIGLFSEILSPEIKKVTVTLPQKFQGVKNLLRSFKRATVTVVTLILPAVSSLREDEDETSGLRPLGG